MIRDAPDHRQPEKAQQSHQHQQSPEQKQQQKQQHSSNKRGKAGRGDQTAYRSVRRGGARVLSVSSVVWHSGSLPVLFQTLPPRMRALKKAQSSQQPQGKGHAHSHAHRGTASTTGGRGSSPASAGALDTAVHEHTAYLADPGPPPDITLLPRDLASIPEDTLIGREESTVAPPGSLVGEGFADHALFGWAALDDPDALVETPALDAVQAALQAPPSPSHDMRRGITLLMRHCKAALAGIAGPPLAFDRSAAPLHNSTAPHVHAVKRSARNRSSAARGAGTQGSVSPCACTCGWRPGAGTTASRHHRDRNPEQQQQQQPCDGVRKYRRINLVYLEEDGMLCPPHSTTATPHRPGTPERTQRPHVLKRSSAGDLSSSPSSSSPSFSSSSSSRAPLPSHHTANAPDTSQALHRSPHSGVTHHSRAAEEATRPSVHDACMALLTSTAQNVDCVSACRCMLSKTFRSLSAGDAAGLLACTLAVRLRASGITHAIVTDCTHSSDGRSHEHSSRHSHHHRHNNHNNNNNKNHSYKHDHKHKHNHSHEHNCHNNKHHRQHQGQHHSPSEHHARARDTNSLKPSTALDDGGPTYTWHFTAQQKELVSFHSELGLDACSHAGIIVSLYALHAIHAAHTNQQQHQQHSQDAAVVDWSCLGDPLSVVEGALAKQMVAFLAQSSLSALHATVSSYCPLLRPWVRLHSHFHDVIHGVCRRARDFEAAVSGYSKSSKAIEKHTHASKGSAILNGTDSSRRKKQHSASAHIEPELHLLGIVRSATTTSAMSSAPTITAPARAPKTAAATDPLHVALKRSRAADALIGDVSSRAALMAGSSSLSSSPLLLSSSSPSSSSLSAPLLLAPGSEEPAFHLLSTSREGGLLWTNGHMHSFAKPTMLEADSRMLRSEVHIATMEFSLPHVVTLRHLRVYGALVRTRSRVATTISGGLSKDKLLPRKTLSLTLSSCPTSVFFSFNDAPPSSVVAAVVTIAFEARQPFHVAVDRVDMLGQVDKTSFDPEEFERWFHQDPLGSVAETPAMTRPGSATELNAGGVNVVHTGTDARGNAATNAGSVGAAGFGSFHSVPDLDRHFSASSHTFSVADHFAQQQEFDPIDSDILRGEVGQIPKPAAATTASLPSNRGSPAVRGQAGGGRLLPLDAGTGSRPTTPSAHGSSDRDSVIPDSHAVLGMSDDSDHSADSDSGGGGGDGDVFLQRLQEREYSHDDVDSDINENVTRTEGNGSSDKQNQRVAGRGEEGALWSSKQRQHRSRSEGHSGGRGLPTAHACEEDGSVFGSAPTATATADGDAAANDELAQIAERASDSRTKSRHATTTTTITTTTTTTTSNRRGGNSFLSTLLELSALDDGSRCLCGFGQLPPAHSCTCTSHNAAAAATAMAAEAKRGTRDGHATPRDRTTDQNVDGAVGAGAAASRSRRRRRGGGGGGGGDQGGAKADKNTRGGLNRDSSVLQALLMEGGEDVVEDLIADEAVSGVQTDGEDDGASGSESRQSEPADEEEQEEDGKGDEEEEAEEVVVVSWPLVRLIQATLSAPHPRALLYPATTPTT